MSRSRYIATAAILTISIVWPSYTVTATATLRHPYPSLLLIAKKHETILGQMRGLHSQDPQVVGAACSALGDWRVKQAATDIGSVVEQSTNPSVTEKCVFALGRIGSPESMPLLRTIATDSNRDKVARVASVRAIALIDGVDASYLVGLLRDSNIEVRAVAAYVLCQLHLQQAVPDIRKMLHSTDSATHGAALTAIIVWPEAFKHDLVDLATEPVSTAEDKIGALTALDSMPPERLPKEELQRLAELLASNSQEVADSASQLLGESAIGKSIASAKGTEVMVARHQNPESEVRVLLATKSNRFYWPLSIRVSVVIISLTAFFPLIILLIQGAPHRVEKEEVVNDVREGSDGRAFRHALAKPAGLMDLLPLASLLALLYFVVWTALLLAWFHGDTLQSHWASSLATVSAATLGAYLWTITDLLKRATQNDLGRAVFWAGLSRFIFAIAASLPIASLPLPSEGLMLVAFFTGAIGPSVVAHGVERLKPLIAWGKRVEKDVSLEAVSGIGIQQKRRLEEENIKTMQQLATADPRELAMRTPFPMATLVDWIDQAIVLCYFSSDEISRLRGAGLRIRALELSLYAPDADASQENIAAMAKISELAPQLLAHRLNFLYHDGQVRYLVQISNRHDKQRWIKKAS